MKTHPSSGPAPTKVAKYYHQNGRVSFIGGIGEYRQIGQGKRFDEYGNMVWEGTVPFRDVPGKLPNFVYKDIRHPLEDRLIFRGTVYEKEIFCTKTGTVYFFERPNMEKYVFKQLILKEKNSIGKVMYIGPGQKYSNSLNCPRGNSYLRGNSNSYPNNDRKRRPKRNNASQDGKLFNKDGKLVFSGVFFRDAAFFTVRVMSFDIFPDTYRLSKVLKRVACSFSEYNSEGILLSEGNLSISGSGKIYKSFQKSYYPDHHKNNKVHFQIKCDSEGKYTEGHFYTREGKRSFFNFVLGGVKVENKLFSVVSHAPFYDEKCVIAELGTGRIGTRGWNGEQTLFWENGTVKYKGSRSNGENNGQGVLFNEDGMKIYDGTWSGGKKNGKGTLYENNEELFVGEFKLDDFFSGFMYEKDKEANTLFKGEYQNGKYTYSGELYKQLNGKYVLVYSGHCFATEEKMFGGRNGHGKEYDEVTQKLVFEGKFGGKGCKRNGNGKYFDDEFVFEGNFKDGQACGQGKIIKTSGETCDVELYKGSVMIKDLQNNSLRICYGMNIDKVKYEFSKWELTGHEKEIKGEGKHFGKDGMLLFDGEIKVPHYKKGNLFESGELVFSGSFMSNYYDEVGPGEKYKGKLFANSKLLYEGEFKSGLYNGRGKLFENETVISEGDFSKGLLKKGSTTFTEGKIIKKGVFYESNRIDSANRGRFRRGDIIDNITGKPIVSVNGDMDYFSADDKEYGSYNGNVELYSENGLPVFEGKYLWGLKHGFAVETEYGPDQKVVKKNKVLYAWGKKMIEPSKSEEKLTKKTIAYHDNGKVWIQFTPKKKLCSECYFEIESDDFEEFTEDGNLLFTGKASGSSNKEGTLFWETGRKMFEGRMSRQYYSTTNFNHMIPCLSEGTLFYKSGNKRYCGRFSNMPTMKFCRGTGYYDDAKGTKLFEGRLNSFDEFSGDMKLYHPNGKLKYEGEMVNGQYCDGGKLFDDIGNKVEETENLHSLCLNQFFESISCEHNGKQVNVRSTGHILEAGKDSVSHSDVPLDILFAYKKDTKEEFFLTNLGIHNTKEKGVKNGIVFFLKEIPKSFQRFEKYVGCDREKFDELYKSRKENDIGLYFDFKLDKIYNGYLVCDPNLEFSYLEPVRAKYVYVKFFDGLVAGNGFKFHKFCFVGTEGMKEKPKKKWRRIPEEFGYYTSSDCLLEEHLRKENLL